MSDTNETHDGAYDDKRSRAALEAANNLLRLSGFDASITVRESSERIELDISVDEGDIPLIVGGQGNTLQAYQLLVNRMVHHDNDDDDRPINLDVAGFGESRARRLARLATHVADAVKERGLEARVYGMNPKDRRSMHMALQTLPGVHTFSEDEGIARRLVISRR